MQNVKVTLNITLPGRVMISREEVRKSPRANTYHTAIDVTYNKWNKASHKKEAIKETLHVFTRKCVPAHQSLNISLTAYEWMTSKTSFPSYIRKNTWEAMNIKERLEVHLKEICRDMGGTSFTYEILPN